MIKDARDGGDIASLALDFENKWSEWSASFPDHFTSKVNEYFKKFSLNYLFYSTYLKIRKYYIPDILMFRQNMTRPFYPELSKYIYKKA